MKRVLTLAICAAGFILIAAPIYMNQETHPFFINGKPIATAMRVNGVWAIPVEDLQKNVEGTFTVTGNRLQIARDAATGLATGKRMHKPFTLTQQWSSSTPMLTGPGGKQYISLNDVGALFDTTFNPPASLRPTESLSLNFTKVTFKYIKQSD